MTTKASHHDELATKNETTYLGFWIYLMTDCVIFASLFATYAVLRLNTAGGTGGNELFNLPFVLAETVILLASSFASGVATLAARYKDVRQMVQWAVTAGVLGAAFVGMELYEFAKLFSEGSGWATSAFLSAFFTLVGTHGLHISLGLVWLVVLLIRLRQRGLTDHAVRRFTLWSMFWHFLDLVWIFIFTIVYLMGVL